MRGHDITRPTFTVFEDALERAAFAMTRARGGRAVVYWPAETELPEDLEVARAELVGEHGGKRARLSYSYEEDCFEIAVEGPAGGYGRAPEDRLYVDVLGI